MVPQRYDVLQQTLFLAGCQPFFLSFSHFLCLFYFFQKLENRIETFESTDNTDNTDDYRPGLKAGHNPDRNVA